MTRRPFLSALAWLAGGSALAQQPPAPPPPPVPVAPSEPTPAPVSAGRAIEYIDVEVGPKDFQATLTAYGLLGWEAWQFKEGFRSRFAGSVPCDTPQGVYWSVPIVRVWFRRPVVAAGAKS